MAKNLMIVESPAKAKTVEKYLGKDFVVRASYGHVRDLPKNDQAIDIEHNFEPKYEVLPDKKKVIDELKKLAKQSEAVWLATDLDREGEAISWHLAQVLKLDEGHTNRIVFNEFTKPAIQKAMESPRKINYDLVNAQQARRVLDRLVGFKISPILWKKIRTGLSAGRVQSVAVRIIVEREREIIDFQPEETFKVTAEFVNSEGKSFKAELNTRLNSEEEARKFLGTCSASTYTITNVETKPAKKSPAAPFTTSTLQQEASRKLSFSVAQTMRVAQDLYEAGHITYMRTDSVNLSEIAVNQAGDVISAQYGKNYHQPRQYKSKTSNTQEAHEAIRPTNLEVSSLDLDRNGSRLYDLIWKRTVASQMADAKLEKTTAKIAVSGTSEYHFVARGEVIKFDGFLKLYIEGRDEEDEEGEGSAMLPPLAEGQGLKAQMIDAHQKYSRHPARYTEASLVRKLEELGIGRPSTYAPTISTVQKRGYVAKETREGEQREVVRMELKHGKLEKKMVTETFGAEKAKLFPTDLGMLVTDFLVEHFPRIVDYSFTANVEEEFDEIARGEKVWNEMIGGFYGRFAEKVETTQETAARVNKERLLGEHPKSGKPIYAKFGRYGPYVQIGSTDEEEKPQFASLRSDQRLDTITLEEALELFKLPRELGEYEGEMLKANIGRFGPYVQLGKVFASIPKDEDPLSITYERAVELMKAKKEAEANKVIKEFNEDVQILNGRYGPYIKAHGANVRIPKGTKPEELTLEDCEKLYEENKNKPKRGRAKKKS